VRLEEHATAFAFVESEISRAAKHKELEIGRLEIVGAIDSFSPDRVEGEIRWSLAKINDVCARKPEKLLSSQGETDDPLDVEVSLVRGQNAQVEVRFGADRSRTFTPKARSYLVRSAAEREHGDEVVRTAEIGKCRSEVRRWSVHWSL